MAINFLQLSVHREQSETGHGQPSHAKVVASAPDLFQALERAVHALHHGGWIVDDLEKFLIGISRPSAETDELLARLYQEAKSIGVAWAIVEGHPTGETLDGVTSSANWGQPGIG